MSWHDSWVVITGEPKESLFEEFGLEETGEEGDVREVGNPYSYLDLGGDRLLLYSNQWGLADEDKLKLLSSGREVLAFQCQDQVEAPSTALCVARNGEALWRIESVGDELTVMGQPPAEFEPIRRKYERQIGDDPSVAIMYEVAHDLGEVLCGFALEKDFRPFKGLRLLETSPLKPEPLKWPSPLLCLVLVLIVLGMILLL